MELTRRDLLKLGVVGTAALGLPLERVAWTTLRLRDRLPESRLPARFQVPFAVPPRLKPVGRSRTTDYYRIVMKRARVEILPGFKTEIWGYNGMLPGPTIQVERGRKTLVRQINRLPVPTSVHLHGNASLPQYDGFANDVTAPGRYKDYHYPNEQDARTLWYHDHSVHITAPNVYMGLAGFYLTHDRRQRSLPTPHGRYDIPLLIRDAIFSSNGSLIFDQSDENGIFGDVILVNGRPWPRMKVERRKYLFRILNASPSRSYELELDSGEDLTVIGTDGGLVPHPQPTRRLRIGMAERYEVVIDFSKYRLGEQVVLRNRGPDNNENFSSTSEIMRFDVAHRSLTGADNAVPDALHPGSPAMRLHPDQSVKRRTFELKRQHGLWTINGRTWDPNRVDANPAHDSVELWTFTNSSGGWFHPLHVHLVDFKILDRNGRPPFGYERGPKDVVYVGEGETVHVLARFGPRKGRYMMHCHNLIHEDHDMMVQFEVGRGGPSPMSAPARALPAPPLE